MTVTTKLSEKKSFTFKLPSLVASDFATGLVKEDFDETAADREQSFLEPPFPVVRKRMDLDDEEPPSKIQKEKKNETFAML